MMRDNFFVNRGYFLRKCVHAVLLILFASVLSGISPATSRSENVVPDLKNKIMGGEVIQELAAVNLGYNLHEKEVEDPDARGRIISQSIRPGNTVRSRQELNLEIGIYRGRDSDERKVLKKINQDVLTDISKNKLTSKYLDRVSYSGPVDIKLREIPVPPDGREFHWQAAGKADFYLMKDSMRYGYALFEFKSRPRIDKKTAYDDAVKDLSRQSRLALLSFFHSGRSGGVIPASNVPVLTVNLKEINDELDKQIDELLDVMQKSFQALE